MVGSMHQSHSREVFGEKDLKANQSPPRVSLNSCSDAETTTAPTMSVIEISKIENGSFGFNVVGGMDSAYLPGDNGIFVSAINESGPAAGLLKLGDKIIKINDIDISSVKHDEAVAAFRSAGITATLLVDNGAELRWATSEPSQTTGEVLKTAAEATYKEDLLMTASAAVKSSQSVLDDVPRTPNHQMSIVDSRKIMSPKGRNRKAGSGEGGGPPRITQHSLPVNGCSASVGTKAILLLLLFAYPVTVCPIVIRSNSISTTDTNCSDPLKHHPEWFHNSTLAMIVLSIVFFGVMLYIYKKGKLDKRTATDGNSHNLVVEPRASAGSDPFRCPLMHLTFRGSSDSDSEEKERNEKAGQPKKATIAKKETARQTGKGKPSKTDMDMPDEPNMFEAKYVEFEQLGDVEIRTQCRNPTKAGKICNTLGEEQGGKEHRNTRTKEVIYRSFECSSCTSYYYVNMASLERKKKELDKKKNEELDKKKNELLEKKKKDAL